MFSFFITIQDWTIRIKCVTFLNIIFHYLAINYAKVSLYLIDHIGDIMVRMSASSVIDRGIEPRLGQNKTKTCKIDMLASSQISMQY